MERERGRKRLRLGEQSDNLTESAVNVLQEVVGQMKTNSDKKTRSQTANEKYCSYLATELDNLSARNNFMARKQINDIVYDFGLKEMKEKENSEDSQA